MKLCDALIYTLQELGVSHVFGVSGANIEHIHDAIHRADQQKIQSVLTKSESGAAFMADGFARISQTLGVCCSTSGGAMLNLASGVAEAQASQVPLLAIVGQVDQSQEGIGGFQDSSGLNGTIDGLLFWQAITKYSGKITRADQFWPTLKRCLQASLLNRKGASALLLPRDTMGMEVGDMPAGFLAELKIAPEVSPALFQQIQQAASLIEGAVQPTVILGELATRSPAITLLRKAISEQSFAVAVTLANVTAFDHDSPLYLGCIGHTGHPSTHQYIEESDVVIAIGTQLDTMAAGPLLKTLTDKSLIVINEDNQNLNPAIQAEIILSGIF